MVFDLENVSLINSYESFTKTEDYIALGVKYAEIT